MVKFLTMNLKPLFIFILIVFSPFIIANDIHLLFDCKKSNLDVDFYKTESICHILPSIKQPILILNKNTNTEINKELLYALTENSYISNGFNTEALMGDGFGYVKFNEKQIENLQKVFKDKEIAKRFITYHELGHIYYNEENQTTFEREMFSDIFALGLFESNGIKIHEIKNSLKAYRKEEALKENKITHYSVFALENYRSNKMIECKKNITCIKKEAKNIVNNVKKSDLIKTTLLRLMKVNDERRFINLLILANLIYGENFNITMSKELVVEKIKKLPKISFESFVSNKKYQDYFLDLLKYNS